MKNEINLSYIKLKRIIKVILGRDVIFSEQIKVPKEMHGSNYGGWTICPDLIRDNSIVYSFGVGRDISFDLSLINKYGLVVHAFDPSPLSITWIKSQQKMSLNFKFHDFGISDFDGEMYFYYPNNDSKVSFSTTRKSSQKTSLQVFRLSTIMNLLGHNSIDILKIDIEGAEYSVIKDIISSNIRIKQILIEFHHNFSEIGSSPTKEAIELLNKHHYRIFHISQKGYEYSFILDDIYDKFYE